MAYAKYQPVSSVGSVWRLSCKIRLQDDISAVQKFIEETTPLVTSESDSSVDRNSVHSEYSHRRTPTDVLLKAKQVQTNSLISVIKVKSCSYSAYPVSCTA